jgi:hypothetical protein
MFMLYDRVRRTGRSGREREDMQQRNRDGNLTLVAAVRTKP